MLNYYAVVVVVDCKVVEGGASCPRICFYVAIGEVSVMWLETFEFLGASLSHLFV